MEENELIAQFMGLEKENGLYLFTTPMDDYKTDTLYFDTSWDWLMPVVEKIYRDRGLDDEIILMIRNSIAELNLESMYKAVVEFIKQYNK